MTATLLIEDLSEAQLDAIEWRMKDRHFSRASFLGPEQSLREVIDGDTRLLRDRAVSHEQIARRLEQLCAEGLQWSEERPEPAMRRQSHAARPGDELPPVRPRRDRFWWFRQPEPIAARVDGFRHLLEAARPVLLPSGFGFACLAYKGMQDCPFADPDRGRASACGCTDCDFLITHPGRREWIVFSGLLPHLIAAHHFFEGRGSAYRLDPELAIRVLGF